MVERRAETPVGWYWCNGRALIASSAAHPVGGDELTIDIEVGPNAHADIGTVAASVVWPGPHGDRSSMRTHCVVGSGAQLTLHPEPTVAVAGADHHAITRVELADDATCHVVEEVALGRTDEISGRIAISLRVERDGAPLVHHDERFGDDRPPTSVSVGRARHVLTAVVVGPPAPAPASIVDADAAGSVLPVAADATVVMAVGADRPAVLAMLDRLGVDLAGPAGVDRADTATA